MEADWAVEIGADVPVIDVHWPGFVDLRQDSRTVDTIPEAAAEPALGDALLVLNGADSPVFTSKCEVWQLAPAEIDPAEFGLAPHQLCAAGSASWVDVLARDPERFASFDQHEAWVRRTAHRLRSQTVAPGRVDLVVRAAVTDSHNGFGITLYAAGCGADTRAAHTAWQQVLHAAVAATMMEVRASSSIG